MADGKVERVKRSGKKNNFMQSILIIKNESSVIIYSEERYVHSMLIIKTVKMHKSPENCERQVSKK